ncbi:MAG: BON domain-containing protein [Verrucomicrobia bacterium]|nr:BON domain-containing protein [Verrucomicrobiota bacterium]
MKTLLYCTLAVAAGLAASSAFAQETRAVSPTAGQVTNTDLIAIEDITRALRRSDSLSASAKATRVSVTNEVVTLQGTVTSIEERTTVESLARKATNDRYKIESQLTLATDQ